MTGNCVRCGVQMGGREGRKYCSDPCRLAAWKASSKARHAARMMLDPGDRKDQSVSARMTDAELDVLIEQMRPTMPLEPGAVAEDGPVPWVVPVWKCSQRWNGRAM